MSSNNFLDLTGLTTFFNKLKNVFATADQGAKAEAAYTHATSSHAPANAEANQNAFSNVKVGSTTVAADSKTDTLEIAAGSNITITPDATNDKITIAATNTTYGAAGTNLGLVKSGGDVTISNGTITVNDDSHNHTISNVDGLQSALDGKLSTSGNAASATKLANARTFSITGGATASGVSFNGTGNVALNVTALDASKLTGTVPIDRLPAGALERLVTVENQAARFSLTTSNVQLGDTVQQLDTGIMYIVVNTGELDNANGYKEYTAATATKVPWSGVTDKPTSFTPSSHTHTIANVTGLQSALDGKLSTTGNAASASKLSTARTISLGGDVTGSTTFDGSGNVTLSVSVKDDSHNHTIANIDGLQDALDDITAGSVSSAPKWTTARNINGMSVDGSANRFNYGTCSTAAATAAKTVACTGFTLATGSEITVKFTVTNTAANPTLNVNSTGAKAIYYNGAAISAGYLKANKTYTFRYNGTQYDLVGDIDTNTTYSLSSFGITATAAELNKLDGVTATATELNYVDGVTSNIQTQLNGKASTSHTHNYAGSSSAGGAANSAVKLSTARTIRTNLGSTSTASFDGSANITPGVTGTLAVGNGGTGATTAAAARTKLGFSGIVVSSTEPTTQNTNEFWLRSY